MKKKTIMLVSCVFVVFFWWEKRFGNDIEGRVVRKVLRVSSMFKARRAAWD